MLNTESHFFQMKRGVFRAREQVLQGTGYNWCVEQHLQGNTAIVLGSCDDPTTPSHTSLPTNLPQDRKQTRASKSLQQS